MQVKIENLSAAALDWAVAKCEFPEPDYEPDAWLGYITEGCSDDGWVFKPSSDWAQGGEIIEREGISVWARGDEWAAESFIPNKQGLECIGATPLIAAMRCYVASKLGDEVEVPEEIYYMVYPD